MELLLAWIATCPKVTFPSMTIKKLREWQKKATNETIAAFAGGKKTFLAEACTGAGKTTYAANVAKGLLDRGVVDHVIVLAPTIAIVNGWTETLTSMGVPAQSHLSALTGGGRASFTPEAKAWVVTYNTDIAYLALSESKTIEKCLVIGDEPHHAERERKFGEVLERLASVSSHTLLITGTPWREKGEIACLSEDVNTGGVPYYSSDSAVVNPDFRYSYQQDLLLNESNSRATVPVYFRFVASKAVSKGNVSTLDPSDWRGASNPADSSGSEDEWRVKVLQGLSAEPEVGKHVEIKQGDTQLSRAECVKAVLNHTERELAEAREQSGLNLTGLVVAKNIKQAQLITDYLNENSLYGFRAECISSDDENANKRLQSIRKRSGQDYNGFQRVDVIVSVGMVAEGVDIPSIKVIGWLTAITTRMFFIQLVGRALRRLTKKNSKAWYDSYQGDQYARVILPADRKLMAMAASLEEIVSISKKEAPSQKPAKPSSTAGLRTENAYDTFSDGSSESLYRGSNSDANVRQLTAQLLTTDYGKQLAEAGVIKLIHEMADSGNTDFAMTQLNLHFNQAELDMEEMLDRLNTVTASEEKTIDQQNEELSRIAQRLTSQITRQCPKFKEAEEPFRAARGEINRRVGIESFRAASIADKERWIATARTYLVRDCF